ncbi:MAG: hypothetical protein WC389_17150 [Lutibacter sp.]|jgi:hypothetical protein
MKKEKHTGFRNEKLFCFHCGESQVMPVPIRIEMATAIMKAFEKLHRNCEKTWIEPVNDPYSKTEMENERWWMVHGEHGISSKTIFNHLSSFNRLENKYEGFPHDPSDFRRCYLLLKACPHFKTRLHRMKTVNPTWANLIDNWDRLTEMLEEQIKTRQPNGMYEFMNSLGT